MTTEPADPVVIIDRSSREGWYAMIDWPDEFRPVVSFDGYGDDLPGLLRDLAAWATEELS